MATLAADQSAGRLRARGAASYTPALNASTTDSAADPRPPSASTSALPSSYDTRASPFLDLGMPFTAYEAAKLVIFAPLLILRVAVALAACCVLACFSWAASAGQ